MNKLQLKDSYDVIIIGGGISGLTSVALLSRAGLNCCLLEMEKRPGGYLAGFDRKQFRFDSAIHWLNNCSENGWVNKVFKIIGDDYPRAIEQAKIRRFISNDLNYLVTNNPDLLKQQWIEDFPEDKKGIIRFFRDAKRISKSFDRHINLSRSIDTMNITEKMFYGIKMLQFALPFIPHIRFAGNTGVGKGLKKYFKSQKLRNIFASEPDLLSCLIPIAWAYSNNYQTPPPGGSQSYPEWLKYAAEYMGAHIILDAKVEKIFVREKTAQGIEFVKNNKTHQLNSKYIVVASDLEALYEKLLPKGIITAQKALSLKNAEIYHSAFTVSIALNCDPRDLGLGEENIYFSSNDSNRKELSDGDPLKSGIHIMTSSLRDPSLAPKGKGTLTLFMPAQLKDHNYWACEKDKNGQYIRGEKYQALKKKYANILIDRVQQKIIPNLRSHIEFYEVATPITLLRYTGNKNGSMMGQRPGKENIKAKVASYKTPIHNLLISGQLF